MLQEAGSVYEYEVRGLHDTLSFVAGPIVQPSTRFSFVVYGDMGESDHSRAKSPGYGQPHMLHNYIHIFGVHLRMTACAVSRHLCQLAYHTSTPQNKC